MNYDNETEEESRYDSERHDYNQLLRLQETQELEIFDDDIDFEIVLEPGDYAITADNFCSKFVGLLKDVEDIKFEMSKLKAEVQSLHSQAGIVMEKLK